MTLDPAHLQGISPRIRAFLDAAGLLAQPRDTNLYHYCSAEALMSIIEKGQIFATDVRFLNDTSEFEYGQSIITTSLGALQAEPRHEILDVFHQETLRRLARRGGNETFVSCYSEVDDLVSQWRGYGLGGNGYSMGFPWRALGFEGKALLLRVVYGDDAVRTAADNVASLAVREFHEAKVHGSPTAVEDIGTCLTTVLLILAVCSKKDLFDFEKEFRLIYLIDAGKPDSTVEFRASKGIIVPFVRLALPREESGSLKIATVRQGPTLNDAATEIGLRAFLDRHGLEKTKILRSEAPLR